jgi:S-adenosylmethionine/arginine decarboxylase-like enzyme
MPRNKIIGAVTGTGKKKSTKALVEIVPVCEPKVLEHKHLIVRAEILKPIEDEAFASEWMRDLVDRIGMQVLQGPWSAYEGSPGNQGITTSVILTTSHAVAHFWSEPNPALLEFDLYSCACFDIEDVIRHFDILDPVKIEYKFLDRKNNLQEIEHSIKVYTNKTA